MAKSDFYCSRHVSITAWCSKNIISTVQLHALNPHCNFGWMRDASAWSCTSRTWVKALPTLMGREDVTIVGTITPITFVLTQGNDVGVPGIWARSPFPSTGRTVRTDVGSRTVFLFSGHLLGCRRENLTLFTTLAVDGCFDSLFLWETNRSVWNGIENRLSNTTFWITKHLEVLHPAVHLFGQAQDGIACRSSCIEDYKEGL